MATALAVATAVAGIAGQAQAFSFGQNDLVLAIYGNNTEALYNLGNLQQLVSCRTEPRTSIWVRRDWLRLRWEPIQSSGPSSAGT